MKQLVIATHNAGKLREISALLAPFGMQVQSAGELNISEPEETGVTFAENAALKALHSATQSGLPALADDSGLVIPALNGDPGIYSARWAGEGKDFSVAFARIERELKAAGASTTPEAYFICVLCLATPDGKTEFFEGRIYGTLHFPPRGDKGFGYDPIFMPEGHSETFGEIAPDVKNRISHRAKAFEALVARLK